MSAAISSSIFNIPGQCVKQIELSEERQTLIIRCERDKRFKAVDSASGLSGRINRLYRREIRDVPLLGKPCVLDVEFAEVFFVRKGM